MTVFPPRYDARQNGGRWLVFDTFAQEPAWRADKLSRFEGLDQATARAQSDALNRIYERTL